MNRQTLHLTAALGLLMMTGCGRQTYEDPVKFAEHYLIDDVQQRIAAGLRVVNSSMRVSSVKVVSASRAVYVPPAHIPVANLELVKANCLVQRPRGNYYMQIKNEDRLEWELRSTIQSVTELLRSYRQANLIGYDEYREIDALLSGWQPFRMFILCDDWAAHLTLACVRGKNDSGVWEPRSLEGFRGGLQSADFSWPGETYFLHQIDEATLMELIDNGKACLNPEIKNERLIGRTIRQRSQTAYETRQSAARDLSRVIEELRSFQPDVAAVKNYFNETDSATSKYRQQEARLIKERLEDVRTKAAAIKAQIDEELNASVGKIQICFTRIAFTKQAVDKEVESLRLRIDRAEAEMKLAARRGRPTERISADIKKLQARLKEKLDEQKTVDQEFLAKEKELSAKRAVFDKRYNAEAARLKKQEEAIVKAVKDEVAALVEKEQTELIRRMKEAFVSLQAALEKL